MPHNRYIPKTNPADWDIHELSKEERIKIKERLVVGITHSEEEFQAIISYMHMKYHDLMDKNPNDGKILQWKYVPHDDKSKAIDLSSGEVFDMYGLVYYDPDRDMEPVAYGASYLKSCGPIRHLHNHEIIPGQNIDEKGLIMVGHGILLFIDPDYRRMGLAESQWITESQLYRDSNIKYQKETQNENALKVTQAMFDDPAKCIIVHKGKIGRDGSRSHIKCVLDYTDVSLVRAFNELPENLKEFRKPFDWTFLKRENLTIEALTEHWTK